MYNNLIELFLSGKTGEQIVDSLPLAVYATDIKGRLTYYNSAAVNLSGREPKLKDDKWCVSWKLFYPDGTPMPHEECPMAVSLKEGYSINGTEAITERPDGERIWFKAYPTPLRNKKGAVIGGINILVDITDQKKAEKELSRSKQELEDFFKNATVGLHLTSSDGIVKRANQAITDMLGYTHEEFVGKPIADFHTDPEAVKHIMKKLSAGEELHNHEASMKCKDGSIRHVLVDSSVYREHGEFIHTRCITRDITKRKQAETELMNVVAKSNKQKRLYETVISATPDLIYVFDLNSRFIFANDALLEMWGRDPQNYIGKSLLEIGYEPWHAEMHEHEIDQVIATKQPVQGEVSFPHSKLGQRVYEYIFAPVLDDKGRVEAVAGTTRDITLHDEAQRNLRKSKEKYQSLFETMAEGFCIIKIEFDDDNQPVDFQYLETNPAFEKHTGLKNVEGKHAKDVLPDYKNAVIKYGAVARKGEYMHVESFTKGIDRWLDLSAFRIGKPNENKVAVLFTDITERKQGQEKYNRLLRQLKIEKNKLVDIFKHAPSCMCIHQGPDHVIERANDLYKSMIGNREVIGKPVREAFPDLEGQGYFDLLDQVYKTGEPYIGTDMKVTLQNPGSDAPPEVHYVDFVYQPIRDSDGFVNGIFIQGVDLTERKRAKEELKAMNENLEERVKERTQALLAYQAQLRSLASKLSKAEESERQRLATELHDNLGQLLALSKMKIDLLKNNSHSDQTLRPVTDLNELINEALSYTRELMSDLKPPPSINNDIVTSIRWVAGKLEKHGLQTSIEDDGNPKPLDEEVRTTVIQSVRELLYNVIKHSSEDKAFVSLERKKDLLHITVKDKGGGFDSESKKLTPEKDGKFGLFNILERIDLIGGNVDIQAKPEKGTRVTLYVPIAKDKEVTEKPENAKTFDERPYKNKIKEKIKVLLADDHQMVREGLRQIIAEQDDIIVVGEANDGKEAIKLSREVSPDIILMDINMPGMGGIEATRKISENMPGIRIIGLSLHDEDGVANEMRNAGASAYLTKSEAFESLVVSIRAEATASKKA